MPLPDPAVLQARRRHSREECIQDLLASLIVGGPPPRWNTPATPSPRGHQFLHLFAGQEASGNGPSPTDDVRFYNEFELPRRHDTEAAGWPDFAVLTPDRLTLIELKAEPNSHRAGQLAHYADLAAHHYPSHQRHLVYLTPPLRPTARLDPIPHLHIGWDTITEALRALWGPAAPADETATAAYLIDLLNQLHRPWNPASAVQPGRPDTIGHTDVEVTVSTAGTAALMALAHQVAEDGTQRAADVDWTDPEQMELARLVVREQSARTGLRVQPWIWRAATSGGHPLTDSGRRLGYELRISRRS
jgi:hypothetical protein